MAISQASRFNSTILGFNLPLTPKLNLDGNNVENSWRKNPIFSKKWRESLHILQINSKIQITECFLSANGQEYNFQNSQEFSYVELGKMKDQELFPDFPTVLKDFKFLRLTFVDIQSGLKIKAETSELKIIHYSFTKEDKILFNLKVEKEKDKISSLKYEFINPAQIEDKLNIEINEFEIKLGVKGKKSNKSISLIANQQKDDFIIRVQDEENNTFFEFHDLAFLNTYFKIEKEINKSDIKYNINPYAKISENTIKSIKFINNMNKEDFNQEITKITKILKEWKKLGEYLKDFIEIGNLIQKTLKKRNILTYSTLLHFYFEPEFENSVLSTNIHVYLKNLNNEDIENIEDQFENGDYLRKEFNNEFTVDFWSQNLD